jgi:hypothetical protein
LFKLGAVNFCALFAAVALGSSHPAYSQSVVPPGGNSYDAWKRYVNNYSRGGVASRPVPTREARPNLSQGLGKLTAPGNQISKSNQVKSKNNLRNMSPDQFAVTSQQAGYGREIRPSKQQVEWFPNRGKRTGIFALGNDKTPVGTFSSEDNREIKVQESAEVFSASTRPARAGRSCESIVEFRYSDKGHIVRHQADPASTYRGVNKFKSAYPTSYVNAYTQPNGVIVKAYRSGKGCNSRVIAEWKWVAPMVIVMRPPNGRNDCTYRRTLDHEMEHVRIYQNTPREYEEKIKQVLSRSQNPSRDYRAIYSQILTEMQRRHGALDNSHFSHSLRGFCN